LTSKTKSPTPTEVDHFAHDAAKRKNIPTAENQGLVPDDDKAVKLLRYPRNPDLDPQLVWRGKDAEDGAPLEVAAPPIYIQEKIHPRAIIENLRRQSKARKADAAPQIDFFHDFNGLEADPEARTEFYQHDQNWQNRMILGDSLQVMGSLAEREALRGKVQCIYFDPPYGIKFNSNWQPSTKSRDVKDGKEDSISREPEVVRAFRDTWKDGIHSYLSYIRDRLIVARDLLTESGSIFVQIGDENVHRMRAVMDEIFGEKNVVSIICLRKTGGQETSVIPNVADYIIWFAKNLEMVKFRQIYYKKEIGVGEGSGQRYDRVTLEDGTRRSLSREERDGILPLASDARAYQLTSLISSGIRTNTTAEWEFRGSRYHSGLNSNWKTSLQGLSRLARADRIESRKTTIAYVRYLDDFAAFPVANIWTDVAGATGIIYVVQTSATIIQRCILMATDPGDLVLDPTCGSGTTAAVAENWGRRWITIDTSRVALTLARARLMGAKYEFFHLKDSKEGAAEEGKLTGKPPANGPFSKDIRQGFVYERAPHVTLKSIANNQEIDLIWDRYQAQLEPLRAALNTATGKAFEDYQIPRDAVPSWSEAAKTAHAEWWRLRRERQREIDASIARNADVEYLYDRPIKAKGVVRVAGPFTVESLSPHRVLPLGEDPYLAEMLEAGEDVSTQPEAPAEPASSTDFASVVYENLLTSGVQNTKKGETLKFEWLKPRVSRSGLVPFEGRYTENGEIKRAAICIGPEYDTVGYDLVKRAAREAADLYDTLIVCGFAFAPEVDETRLNFGELKVLRARMNQDLRMGDKLKATGAGNLFVVFGEPDIVVHQREGGMVQAEIRGMDIFDPTTGQVRSSGGDDLKNDVAAWFVDDDYNEESFFVKQAYFVGDSPYEALKRALKAEIDETAWEEMNSTISRPFPKPESGRICVKVINHFGDEVQKVFVV
jgi:adenine-specific DNA-methyltransferase